MKQRIVLAIAVIVLILALLIGLSAWLYNSTQEIARKYSQQKPRITVKYIQQPKKMTIVRKPVIVHKVIQKQIIYKLVKEPSIIIYAKEVQIVEPEEQTVSTEYIDPDYVAPEATGIP